MFLHVRVDSALIDSPSGTCEPINTTLNTKRKEPDRHIHKYPETSQVPIISSQREIRTNTGLSTEEEEVFKEAEPNLLLIAPK